MTKHKQYFEDMLTYNKELFDEFKVIHDKYAIDPKTFKEEFNEKGQEAMDIIRRYENMLCGKSEGGKFSKFSGNLSDKFRELIREHFPKIDFVGIV
ncbi:MAG: hypothetical protein Q7K55_01715 [Candidatus Levybacteria bacterium]|nr:hypothetical protein [Candidatus Levybacteria bacterium]